MIKNDYVLGVEQSGHIIFSRYASTGDGILTAIMLMETIMEEKTDLCILADGMKKYPQILENVKVEDRDVALDSITVKAMEKEISDELGEQGRIVLRASGTEPLIRVMVEASTEEECRKMVDKMVSVLE